MNLEEYLDGVKRTESSLLPLDEDVLVLGLTNRMYHGIVGLCTEAGEIVEAYTKNDQFHIDYVNVAEELGDMYWYLGVLIDELGIKELEIINVETIPLGEIPLVLSVETTRMLDKTKKTMFYGKKYDVDLLRLDVMYLYDTLHKCVWGLKRYLPTVTVEKIWDINLNKLKMRYPEKFNLNDAEVRDLQKERVVLEKINNAN